MAEIDYGKATGMVRSTESSGSVGGLGIRSVVSMQDYKMCCQYCYNPNTWTMETNQSRKRIIDDMLAEALRYKHFQGKNGGITVSGGEAILQVEFATVLSTKTKELGIRCVLDTYGFVLHDAPKYHEIVGKLLAVTDLILLDLKEISPKQHIVVTRQPNTNILVFARYLSDKGTPVWIRHVLVSGSTDLDDDLIELGKFVTMLKNVGKFEVLSYHTLGGFKRHELGIPYTLEDVRPSTREHVQNVKDLVHTESYTEYMKRIHQ